MNVCDIKDAHSGENWHDVLAKKYQSMHFDDLKSIDGSTPPSVFVGAYNYPSVLVGPMLPPIHGDTRIFDSPEKWGTLSFNDVLRLRFGMICGTKKIKVNDVEGRYIQDLQHVALSSKSLDSDIVFDGGVHSNTTHANRLAFDDDTICCGPVGTIESVKFSGTSTPSKQIQNTYYDTDMHASDAIMTLYESGVAVSSIYRSLSMGMLGIGDNRKLVPTKWSITATDSIISSQLLNEVRQYDIIDACKVFWHSHFGNTFAIVLFPHMWMFELVEAWYSQSTGDGDGGGEGSGGEKCVMNKGGVRDVGRDVGRDATHDTDNIKIRDCKNSTKYTDKLNHQTYSNSKNSNNNNSSGSSNNSDNDDNNTQHSSQRQIAFGADSETLRVCKPPVNTAGAYYSAKLATLEYLHRQKIQAGVLVLREITPAYTIPVGVWQVREGVRAAMKCKPLICNNIHDGISRASSVTNIAHDIWTPHSNTMRLVQQRTISDYL